MKSITKYRKCPLNGLALSLVFSFSAVELKAETEQTQDSTETAAEETTTEANQETNVASKGEALEGVCPSVGKVSAMAPNQVPSIPFSSVFEKSPLGYGDKISKIELGTCHSCAKHKKSLKMKFLDGSELSLEVDAPEFSGIPQSKKKRLWPLSISKSSNQSLPNVDMSFEGNEELKAYIKMLMLKKALAVKIYGCHKNSAKGITARGGIIEDKWISQNRFKKKSKQERGELNPLLDSKKHIEESAALDPNQVDN